MSGVIPGFARSALRSCLVLSLLLAVAACAQNGSRYGGYNRPASYDPPGPPSDPWGPYIRDASRRFDVPEQWVREVMRQESGGRTQATSRVGAQGLMQVMPGTYAELQRRYNLGSDAYHPYDNIMAGAAYIREMYDLYGSPAFLAAYNAGPRRLEDYLWNGGSLPGETRNYVARIGPRIEGARPSRRAPPEVYAAAELPHNIAPGPRRMDGGTVLALQEQRRAREGAVQVATAAPAPAFRSYTPDPAPVRLAAAATSDPAFQPYTGTDAETPSIGAARPESASGSRIMASALAAPALAAPLRRDARGRPIPALAEPARVAPSLASRHQPSAPPAAGRGLGLIGSAHAAGLRAPPPAAPAARGAGWSVQIGAFASENIARSAAQQARDSVQLLGARTVVQPVQQGRGMLYRARISGLTRDGAEQACTRLRARGGCTIVAPGADS